MSDNLVSTRAAAERAGVSAKTIGRWVDAGLLRAVFTAGGHRRVSANDLDAFLASRQSLLSLDVASSPVVVVGTSRAETVAAFRTAADRLRLTARIASANAPFELGLLVGRLVPTAVILDVPNFRAASDVVAALRLLAFPGRIGLLSDALWPHPATPDATARADDPRGPLALLRAVAVS